MARSEAQAERLGEEFFARSVHDVARELIGATICVGSCEGRIVETEAYTEEEPACHAFAGLTARTEVLFGPPGRAYVYLSYGVHALLNAVCEPEGRATAVLIRALEPLGGVELMRRRRGLRRETDLCSGPGKLTQALGVGLDANRTSLAAGPVALHRRLGPAPDVVTAPRVGITKAVELPWRYCEAASPFVSRPKPR